jgi:hypothetical protein
MPIIYKIMYPNGKIHVGKDMTDSINYFGSADHALVAADFTAEQRRRFTVTREVLWESATATLSEVNAMEVHYIRLYRSNDPAIGYNRWPKLADSSVEQDRAELITPARVVGPEPPPRKPVMSFDELMRDLEQDREDRA